MIRYTQAVLRMDEARKSADLDAAVRRYRNEGVWTTEGWPRDRIIREVDPSFIHHDEHFSKLLSGGIAATGRPFAGGGGLRWGGLVVSEEEALLRVMGSLEYPKPQEVYQQTVRFSNYHTIAEDEELSWSDKARLLLTRDHLRLHCDCDAFRYYHARPATVKGFALHAESRAAPSNNPHDRGGVCKHLNVTLKWLGGQSQQLASEMKKHHAGPEA